MFTLKALATWMLVSKFIKLLGHYIRYPVDFVLLPVSILFGYFHGLIKLYAAFTLNVVSPISPSPFSRAKYRRMWVSSFHQGYLNVLYTVPGVGQDCWQLF